ncbi:hypothetical protein CRUP_006813 [Coryphaenoides rupestris]|nr:hypothetical protein CRUP_006813 [Coryphaenoides rupestris]
MCIVMLWLVAFLLTLAEDVFSQGKKETPAELLHIYRRLRWSAANDAMAEELTGDMNHGHAPWPSLDPTPQSTPPRKKGRKKPASYRDCRIEKKQLRVRDLGLGFDSEEIVMFKYCVGTCQGVRENYDLALKAMMEAGSVSHRRVSTHPCCRPTRYETVSFMDVQTIWQTIRRLSAANCSCVG